MENTGSSTEALAMNGLDGASGEYLLPPMTAARIAALAQGQSFQEQELRELRERNFRMTNSDAGVEADARNLAETGWGVIFAARADPAVREALSPLLRLRQEVAGERYQEYWGEEGYHQGETKDDFLSRFGMGPGPCDPDRVPYYLLIVGDPETIPFRFQYALDVQYAVGRIDFETPGEFAQYAQSVVRAEKTPAPGRRAVFFGPANPGDRASRLSATELIQPLAEKIRQEEPKWAAARQGNLAPGATGDPASFLEVQTVLGEAATRQRLSETLNGKDTPALLFTASHGLGFPSGHTRQLPEQGALVCQDWPGPQNWRGPLPEDFYISAGHMSDEANLQGTLAFFFACYAAGAPRDDEFARQASGGGTNIQPIAPHSFLASLPRRMLSLPRGGALGVIGHIDRAWGTSFFWGAARRQIQVFSDCFQRLLKGNYPVGYALEVFNNRYAELSTELSSELNEIRLFGKIPDEEQLAGLWSACLDARNYVLLGDPAVRLNLVTTGK